MTVRVNGAQVDSGAGQLTNADLAPAAGIVGSKLANETITSDKIADQVDFRFLPPGVWTAAGGSPARGDILANGLEGWALDDASTEGVKTQFTMPGRWNAATPVAVRLYFATAANTGNAVIRVSGKSFNHAVALSTAAEVTDDDTVDIGTAMELRQWTHGFAITPTDADSLNYLRVERIGGNGSDTLTGDLYFLGAMLDFTDVQ